MFSTLLAACALQGVVISLAQYYGMPQLRRLLQPVTATLIPPLAWVTFQATAVRAFSLASSCPISLGPALTILCLAFAPAALIRGLERVPGLWRGHPLRLARRRRRPTPLPGSRPVTDPA